LEDEQGERTGWVSVVRDITERKRAEQALERRVAELKALNAIAMVVNESLEVKQILKRAVDQALRQVGAEAAGILLLDEEAGELELTAYTGITEQFARSVRRTKLGEGMAGRVAQTGEPVVIGRAAEYPGALQGFLEKERIQSVASIPLVASTGVVGVMNLGTASPEYFDAEGLELLVGLGRQIAFGLEKARLHGEIRRWATELEERVAQRTGDIALVNTLNEAVNQGKSLQEIINLLAREAGRAFGSNAATVYLLSEDGQYLVMQNLNLPPGLTRRIEKLIGRSIPPIAIPCEAGSLYWEMLHTDKPRAIDDPQTVQQLMAEFARTPHLPKGARAAVRRLLPRIYKVVGVQSVLNVPLVSEGKAIGLLDISRREPFADSDVDRLMTLSGQLTTIIERKRTEEALRDSERRYRHLFDASPVGIGISDHEGRVLAANRSMQEMTGYSLEEFGEVRLGDTYVDPGERASLLEVLLESGRVRDREVRLRRKDGAVYAALLNVDQVAVGGQTVFLTTARDVTEQKRAEEVLRESEERFRSTFEQAAVGIAHVAPDGTFLRINQRFCDIVGYTREDMLRRTFQDITHPDDLEADLGYVQQMLDGEIQSYSMEKRYIRKDDSLMWIDLTVSLVRDAQGAPKYFISAARDISRRKQAEEELVRRVEELEHFNRLAVGRELRMVELKRRVNELSAQLGQESPYDLSVLEG
jgi:PAS domain S-box-containing protein